MNATNTARLRRLLHLRPTVPDRYRELIARHVRGRTFIDVGCMWGVHGAYAFHALDGGATQVTGVDLMSPSPEFVTRNLAYEGRVRFVQGDINDPSTAAALGTADVVFCAGVLYHVPNPLLTLEHLRRICAGTLLLGSATIPEQRQPQTAVFLPFLSPRARRALSYRSADVKIGLDTDFVRGERYANWFWGLTASAVEAMVRAAGFEVRDRHRHRRSICLVCAAV